MFIIVKYASSLLAKIEPYRIEDAYDGPSCVKAGVVGGRVFYSEDYEATEYLASLRRANPGANFGFVEIEE